MQSGPSSRSSSAASPRPAPAADGGHGRTVWTLGLGAFGLAFSLTTTAAYLPPLLGRFTDSTTLIALVLAAEGLFALTLPLVIGPWSDGFHTPLGRRRPFMLVALGPICFCLALLAFMPNLWTTALLVCAFFFAYYVYEPPYRGLYPDLLPDRIYGRAQSVQHVLRGAALGAALIGGGALFHVWEAWPFLVAAIVVTAACSAPVLFVREDGGHGRVFEGVGAYVRHSWRLFRRERDVRRFLLANTAWEGTFAGARTFVVLYLTVGLGQPLGTTTAVLAAVAGGYVVAAVASGWLGDRFGLARVIFAASFLYGAGLLAGGFAHEWHRWFLPVIFLVAIAGGAVMTLSWGLLFKLMPTADRGAISGLATTTKGIGLIFGTLLAGILIDVLAPYLPETEGYQVLWPALAIPILLAVPLVFSLIRAEELTGGS
ncbi:MAG TPA: MFS transporter [Gaiellaceae bacterium]|nr:MFS transporter [Gaiellaceae bacterium]